MKKKAIEAVPPRKTRKSGWWTTLQLIEGVIVLNVFKDRVLRARHCVNPETKEYATFKKDTWYTQKIENAYGIRLETGYYYWSCENEREAREKGGIADEDRNIIQNLMKESIPSKESIIEYISHQEMSYGRSRREIAEHNRVMRVNAMMAKVPAVPEGIKEWINQKELGGMDYCIKDRETGRWSCSACGREFEEQHVKKTDGTGQPRNNDMVTCPICKKSIQIKKRKKTIEVRTHFCMMQPIDNEVSVTRHFTATVQCVPNDRKRIGIEEDVRIIMFKGRKGIPCDLYYEQYSQPGWVPDGGIHIEGCFDNKHNPANKSEYFGYLYETGIEEALKDTVYEPWARLFKEMAAAGLKLQYNAMMIGYHKAEYIRLIELLFRGRFYQLLTEESQSIYYWSRCYYGELELSGNSIEEVFKIGDRQKINRIRQMDGGRQMVEWMRWSDKHGQKISDKTLMWLKANDMSPESLHEMTDHFSVEQIMNYIERQRAEQYKGKSAKVVVEQYGDYIRMCKRLHKDISDEMIYRPRELKRRHDEAVLEIERQQAQLKAEEYSKKFGEAENVLKEIKDKYEYKGEQYFIMVPDRIVDIVSEGNHLHHCAGATDRYFDRIKQHETYICFLRKIEEPETPYYTIEVEPGGTIRQHRGMYDEEPEIDEVKPFLREWQREIKKRMSRQDRERAAASKVKREENIEELKQKNNIRVLNGLMEDFMEAIG
ncbi:MAG: PcfJ domain-containing protein [Lachnospiraceae bacterium]|nr:PcfJ domain-containing protein [Lachnospiraceae bacterium]